MTAELKFRSILYVVHVFCVLKELSHMLFVSHFLLLCFALFCECTVNVYMFDIV